jgi:glycosyltransferase involved in cell wall biosynthesis
MRGSFDTLSAVFELRQLIKKFSPRVLQCWMYHANLFGTLASLGLPGIELFWGIRNSFISPDSNSFLTRIVVALGGLLSHLVRVQIIYNSVRAETVHTKSPVFGCAKHKGRVIPNGFDTHKFSPSERHRVEVRRELGVNSDAPLVGIFGRYHPVKAHESFLAAAALVAREIPAAKFLMCGAGLDSENKLLRHLIESLGIQSQVLLLGKRTDMPRLMAALDLMVLSSKAESFPRVIGEALACEIPCVSTDVGDCRELLADCGRIVAVGSSQEMSVAIIEYLQLSKENLQLIGKRGRARIESKYSVQSIVAQYCSLYDGLAFSGKITDGRVL